MGTRHLIAVHADGKYPIAQYGQWDGYPDAQGVTVLKFCASHLSNEERRIYFREQLARCRFVDGDELSAAWQDRRGRGRYLTRDHGAEILQLVHDARDEVLLKDAINFAGDSLLCEWAYVVDLDRRTFEVFRGFNKAPLDPSERFASAPLDHPEYQPVRRLVTFNLDALPDEAAFLKGCERTDEDDEQTNAA